MKSFPVSLLIPNYHIATLVSTLANLEGEETFESGLLGYAEEVVQERISDDECILIKGTKAQSSASIILRGPNDYALDEMERSMHDVLCVIKRALESNSVVPGGGAVEAAASIFLENFATTLVCTGFVQGSPTDQAIYIYRRRVSSWPLQNLPRPCWSFPRRWLSTLPRIPLTWSPNCVLTTIPHSWLVRTRRRRTSSGQS
jgi:hypothetical protein